MDQNDFEIELLQESAAEVSDIQIPQNYLSFGELSSEDVKVYVKQDVYQALEKLAASDMSRELGSILLGTYCHDQGEYHVVISAYIEAKYTEASASTLTFTHETWEYVHQEHEKRYPDLKIIGWQHTHPSYGIFLSNYDRFIQENFFDLPFQVAYVIDPVQKLRGFFQWKEDKIEKLKGYLVYDDAGKTIRTAPETDAVKVPQEKKRNTSNAVTTVLCVLLVILSIGVLSLNRRLARQEKILANLTAAIGQLQIETEQEDIATEFETADDQDDRFITHYVQSGETLAKICDLYGLNYGEDLTLIRQINGLTTTDLIYPDQPILLPVKD